MSELISVSRSVFPRDYEKLIPKIEETRKKFPGLSKVDWKDVGEVAVKLVELGEYASALHHPKGKLKELKPEEQLKAINDVIQGSPVDTGIFVRTSNAAAGSASYFAGENGEINVGYYFRAPYLIRDRNFITSKIDELNGVHSHWPEHAAHMAIGTIPPNVDEDPFLLGALERARPSTIILGRLSVNMGE